MKLNKIIEITAYAVGGVSLFLVSFLVFALAAGVPANEVAILGNLFPEPAPVPEVAEGEEGENARPKIQPKTPEELIQDTIGRLPTHTARSPFQDGEVDELVAELKRLKLENEQLRKDYEDRIAALDEREGGLDEQAALIQELMAALDVRQGEIALASQELERDQVVADEAEVEKFKKIAATFAGKGDVAKLVRRLENYGADDGARILANLEEKRRTELLNAMPEASSNEFTDAWASLGY